MDSSKEVDQWIAQLSECKPLTENQVKRLCEKVVPIKNLCLHLILSIFMKTGKRNPGERIQRTTSQQSRDCLR